MQHMYFCGIHYTKVAAHLAISADLDYPYLFLEDTPSDSSICRIAGTFRPQDHANKRGRWKR